MLLDSNIIIYSALPEYASVRQFISENSPAASWISYLEVLGFHKLTEADRPKFEMFSEVST